ncbi:MAG: tryptophanyl-tRNA synthetase [Candidatus Woesearchaeota archaeon]|nr:tryptophanyl-tRNA synthetase [Candidatus Woesearchaeota archaeon]
MKEKSFEITPWKVSGDIDYDRVIREFGVSRIDENLLKRFEKVSGELHPFLKRGIFFAHRDLDWLLSEYEKGNEFFLYTGRGPSGKIHLGHLVPWIFTKWLQDKFDVELWFQMTDDEKFYFNEKLSLEETNRLAYENALDVIALGFNPKKTIIFTDTDLAGALYKYAAKIAKKITFSMIRASFGLKESSNIGQIFFTSMQAVPAILKSEIEGRNVPCLIPHAIDQDPHFRLARDVLPKLGYYKPASIQSGFLPGLQKVEKMSASNESSAIFTTDSEEEVRAKVMKAFTGGRISVEEQRKYGGNPDICSVYQYYYMLFMLDDSELNNIRGKCLNGEIMCGECKEILINKINNFLKEHQRKREEARKEIDKYIISEDSDLKKLLAKKR